MKTVTEYRNELYDLVESMDEETFETWFGSFSPSSRDDMPAVYNERYKVNMAKKFIERMKREREETRS